MPTIDTGITENDLLEALAAQLRTTRAHTRKPGDFTREELQKASGRGKVTALRFLQEQMDAGILERVRVIDHGVYRQVYRKRNGAPGTQTGSA